MSDFDDLYLHSYRRLVLQLSAYLGDPVEAEDVVQEAYLRAWQRWDRISGYDDPAAWVRRVAWNLATSRWRRLSLAARHRWAPGPVAEVVAETTPDRVALVEALRDLPDTHRRAVVLHYLGDVPVGEIADELAVPRGTVLSWLHRSRLRLADLLVDDALLPLPTPPPPERVAVRARRRARTKLTAVIAALLTGATAAAAMLAPFVAGIPTPTTRLEDVDWTSGTISLPDRSDENGRCPTGRKSLEDAATAGYPGREGLGYAQEDNWREPLTKVWIDGRSAVFADLTGDRVVEAILPVRCAAPGDLIPGQADTFNSDGHLLVVTRRSGRLVALAYLGPARAQLVDFHVDGGRVTARFRVKEIYSLGWDYGVDSPAHVRTYAWNGSGMVQVGGRTRALYLLHGHNIPADPIDFPDVRRNGVTICPGHERYVKPKHRVYLGFRLPPAELFVRQPPAWFEALEIDLDDDGNAEVLAFYSCGNVSISSPSLFVLKQADDRFVTLDVPLPNDGSFTIPDAPVVNGHTFSVTIRDVATGNLQKITMTWNGTRFVNS